MDSSALPHVNFFKFHVPTSALVHVLFPCICSHLWNSLPHSVRFCESLIGLTSRKHLRTFYLHNYILRSAFSNASYTRAPQIQFFSYFAALYIDLLTFSILLRCSSSDHVMLLVCAWESLSVAACDRWDGYRSAQKAISSAHIAMLCGCLCGFLAV